MEQVSRSCRLPPRLGDLKIGRADGLQGLGDGRPASPGLTGPVDSLSELLVDEVVGLPDPSKLAKLANRKFIRCINVRGNGGHGF